MSSSVKPSTAFWVIAIIATLWNLMGVAMYMYMATTTPESVAENYGAAFAEIFVTKPAWATGAFAIGVFGGLLGCIGLLLRKAWSKILFIISLIGIIVHDIWGVMAGTLAHIGSFDKFMTVVVVLIAIFLIWFASKNTNEGVLS